MLLFPTRIRMGLRRLKPTRVERPRPKTARALPRALTVLHAPKIVLRQAVKSSSFVMQLPLQQAADRGRKSRVENGNYRGNRNSSPICPIASRAGSVARAAFNLSIGSPYGSLLSGNV